MKMKPEHFNTIKDCMNATRHNPAVMELDLYGNLSDIQFLWKWFYLTPIEGLRPEAWAFKNLHPYLNDNHIETALKKIL